MSKNGNIIKNDLLGIPYGTAQNRLRKMIMFHMMQKLGEDICFRCREKIETINDFSIEHINAWQQAENPEETFFDLKNITFSHLKCNISAGKRMERNPVVHGTSTAYRHGCRCFECKNSRKLYMRDLRKRLKN